MHPPYYRGCWHGLAGAYSYSTVIIFLYKKEFTHRNVSSSTRRCCIRLFVHCAIFPTAASRRSLDRVSVPVWLIILSNQLGVIALVSHYPHQQADTIQTHPLALKRFPIPYVLKAYRALAVVSNCYSFLEGRLSIHSHPCAT